MPTNQELLDALIAKANGTDTDTWLPEFESWAEALSLAGDSSGNSLQVADTIADLKALTASASAARPTCIVRGYYSAGDGGGGLFRWNGASTATDNGGTVIALTAGGTGRWDRVVSGAVNVKWFGATGDGDTDDTAAFQAALDSWQSVYAPYTSSGYVIGALTLSSAYASVSGDGQRTKLIAKTGTARLFSLSASNVVIDGFEIDGANITESVFYLDTSSSFDRLDIRNIVTDQAPRLIKDATSTGRVDELYVERFTALRQRGDGFSLTDSFAFTYLTRCVVDYVGSSDPNGVGFALSNNEGAIFEDCDVIGTCGVGSTNSSQKGFSVSSCAAVWMRRCMADTCGGRGFDISNCTYFYPDDLVASQCDGNGIALNNVDVSQGGKVTVKGRNDKPSPTASVDGVLIQNNCEHLSWTNVLVTLATGDGFKVDNSTSANTWCLVSSLKVFGNTGWGVRSIGAGGVVLVNGVQANGNASGNVSLASTFDRVLNAQVNSGASVGFGDMLPGSSATYDIGSSALKYRDIYVSRNAEIGAVATIGTNAGNAASPTASTTNLRLYHISDTNYAGFLATTAGSVALVTGTTAPAARWEVTSGGDVSLGGAYGSETLRVAPAGGVTHRSGATVVDASGHLGLRSYTVATLPSASASARMIYVSDGTSNKRLAVSDGTNWRWPDGAVVS